MLSYSRTLDLYYIKLVAKIYHYAVFLQKNSVGTNEQNSKYLRTLFASNYFCKSESKKWTETVLGIKGA